MKKNENHYSLSEIGRDLSLSEATIRNYRALAEPYLSFIGVGRGRRYTLESKKILEFVAQKLKNGLSKEDVEKQLKKKFNPFLSNSLPNQQESTISTAPKITGTITENDTLNNTITDQSQQKDEPAQDTHNHLLNSYHPSEAAAAIQSALENNNNLPEPIKEQIDMVLLFAHQNSILEHTREQLNVLAEVVEEIKRENYDFLQTTTKTINQQKEEYQNLKSQIYEKLTDYDNTQQENTIKNQEALSQHFKEVDEKLRSIMTEQPKPKNKSIMSLITGMFHS